MASRYNWELAEWEQTGREKKRLLAYAAQFPEQCQQTDDDEQGGLRFEIDKSRTSLTVSVFSLMR